MLFLYTMPLFGPKKIVTFSVRTLIRFSESEKRRLELFSSFFNDKQLKAGGCVDLLDRQFRVDYFRQVEFSWRDAQPSLDYRDISG
jgi:hypothetical protein